MASIPPSTARPGRTRAGRKGITWALACRSDQLNNDRDGDFGEAGLDPARTMLGARQEAWLHDGLRPDDGHRWHVLAHQVGMANLAMRHAESGDTVYSSDQWSGYLAARRRLLGHLEQAGMTDVVTVCGDAHRHFASDLLQDNGGKVIQRRRGASQNRTLVHLD